MPMADQAFSIADVAAQRRALAGMLPGAAVPWLARLREEGAARFAELGLPTRKAEEWKYTDLAALRDTAFAAAPGGAEDVRAAMLPAPLSQVEEGPRLVFVNGRLSPGLSRIGNLPAGAEIGGLADRLEAGGAGLEALMGRVGEVDGLPFLALNTAFLGDGFVLRLGRGTVLEVPIEILFVGRGAAGPVAFHPRNLILAGPDSRATVIERHISLGPGGYFADAVTEVVAEDGAEIRHLRLQETGPEAFHFAMIQARVERGARYDGFELTTGAGLARSETRLRLVAAGAACTLMGAYLARGHQHVDTTTVIDHEAPETTSRQIYKGALDEQARAVFQGRIVVHPGAEKTDGHQANHTLLLCDGTEIDTKPELEIYAGDVKCSHGATAGALDEEALFYLRSRGLPEAQARRLLVEAFLGEVVAEVAAEDLRAFLSAKIATWMNFSERSGQ